MKKMIMVASCCILCQTVLEAVPETAIDDDIVLVGQDFIDGPSLSQQEWLPEQAKANKMVDEHVKRMDVTDRKEYRGINKNRKIFLLDGFKNFKREDLTEVSRYIGNLKGLQEIQLMGCTNLQILPESLTNLPYLKKISLQGCRSLNVESKAILRILKANGVKVEPVDLIESESIPASDISYIKENEEVKNFIAAQSDKAVKLDLSKYKHISQLPSLKRFSKLKTLIIASQNLNFVDITSSLNLEELILCCPELEAISAASEYKNLKTVKIQDSPKLIKLPVSFAQANTIEVTGCASLDEPSKGMLKMMKMTKGKTVTTD